MVVWGVHDRGGQSADLARWIAKGADLFVRSLLIFGDAMMEWRTRDCCPGVYVYSWFLRIAGDFGQERWLGLR